MERRVGKAERRLDEVEEGQRIEVPSEAERGQQLEQRGEKRAGTEGSQIEADEVSGQRQHLRRFHRRLLRNALQRQQNAVVHRLLAGIYAGETGKRVHRRRRWRSRIQKERSKEGTLRRQEVRRETAKQDVFAVYNSIRLAISTSKSGQTSCRSGFVIAGLWKAEGRDW